MRSVAIIETDRADRSPLEPVRAAIEAHPGVDHFPASRLTAADVVVALGDRLDSLEFATEYVQRGAVLVHLHGGEVTVGCQDNRWRYALSAIADVHCTATHASRERLIAHGEEPERIHVVGAPGLDRLRDFVPYERGTHGIPEDPFVLCTVHPEPTRDETLYTTRSVIDALLRCKIDTVWTAPNGDPHADAVRNTVYRHPHLPYDREILEDAGTRLYLSLMAHAAVMVGNSSSGIIEAPEFGLPVVNVGRRQEGRERAGNVRDVPVATDAIYDAIRYVMGSTLTVNGYPNPYNPHGDHNASGRIADIIAGLDLDAYREKTFAC